MVTGAQSESGLGLPIKVRSSACDFVERRREEFYPKSDTLLTDGELRGLGSLTRQMSLGQARVALESCGIQASSVVALDDTGTFHALFACVDTGQQKWVLKVNRISDRLVDFPFEAEFSVSTLLEEQGIPHAKVIAVDLSRAAVPFDFVVMEFADGRSFRSFDAQEDEVMLHLPALARYLRKCHDIAGTGFGLLSSDSANGGTLAGLHTRWWDYLGVQLDRHIRLVAQAGLVTTGEARDIRRVFSELETMPSPEKTRLLHGDCGPHNAILTANGGISMIDWEDALAGDPLFEVAMWATFNPTRRWGTFFDSYFSSAWKPDSLFWIYFLRISLAKAVVRLRFGYKDVPGRPPASTRIQQSLDALSPARRTR